MPMLLKDFYRNVVYDELSATNFLSERGLIDQVLEAGPCEKCSTVMVEGSKRNRRGEANPVLRCTTKQCKNNAHNTKPYGVGTNALGSRAGTMLGGEVRNYQFSVGSTAGFCPQPPSQPSSKYCTNSCCRSVSSILSSAGVCLLVVGYTLLGAVTFMALEGRQPAPAEHKPLEHDHLRSQTVEKLWSITEDLNILYKDNWTRLAEQEVLKFQNSLVRKHKQLGNSHKIYNWSFPSAFLYSLTLITTIGYGSVTPKTAWGRIITIAYALVGIPLMLVYLSTVGDTLAQHFRRLYSKLSYTKNHKSKTIATKNEGSVIGTKPSLQNHIPNKVHELPSCMPMPRERVPIFLTLMVVVGYISGGGFLFNKLEKWSFIEGSYFCFTSLGTIGFGELVPGTTSGSSEMSVFISSAFILVGMAIIAMCFNLIQDETVVIVRKLSLWWHKPEKIEEEDLSITVKSS